MDSDTVALAAIFFIFGLPVTAFIVSRVLKHNERMAMIRAGIIPPNGGSGSPPKGWQQAGYAQPSATARDGCQSSNLFPGDYAQQQLAKGIRLTMVGVALLIGLSFIGHGYFGPWMLGGLIPMFVGIAQIITAILAGARFMPQEQVNGAHPQQGFYAGPPPGAAAPPPGPPYGWRPGSTPEIQKPAGPPDIN
ncbi:MAG: hypothetical protein ACLQPV_01465 [Vulcanimicrobiaceae bacterium]